MRRMRRFRIVHGLPRGGLGRVGWAPSLAAVVAALVAHTGVAAAVGLLCLPLCVWCAAGLRRDDAAGEASDWYSARWHLSLLGEWEPTRRRSTAMVGWCLFALLVSAVRCWWLLT
jgi:hypothetical protein